MLQSAVVQAPHSLWWGRGGAPRGCRTRVLLRLLGMDTAPARECHGAVDYSMELLNTLLTTVRTQVEDTKWPLPNAKSEIQSSLCFFFVPVLLNFYNFIIYLNGQLISMLLVKVHVGSDTW